MFCANPQHPMGPGEGRRIPNRTHPTYFANLRASDAESHCDDHGLATTNCETKCQPKWVFSKHSNAFASAAIGSLKCSSHNSRRVMVLPKISFFASWIIEFLTPVPGRFHRPESFRCLTLTRLFGSCCLAHPALPILSLQFPFLDSLTKGVPVRINWRRSPPLKLNVLCVNEDPLRAHLVSSQS